MSDSMPKYGARDETVRKAADRLTAMIKGEPQEVTIVRPEVATADFFGNLIGATIGVFIRGALIMWAASHVSFVPDFGYFESVWIGLLATWVFHRNDSSYRMWTKMRKTKS